MRKLWVIGAAAVLVLALAAIAYAQTQDNTYTVVASTSPTNAGTSKKPVPTSVTFNYTVGESHGLRPSPIKKYSIGLKGIVVNGSLFPKCSATQLKAANGIANCAKAKVGSGFVENLTGATNNPDPNAPNNRVTCNLELSVYNAGARKGLLLLEGGASETDPRRQCPLDFGPSNGIIDANYVSGGGQTALEFNVPNELLHPAPGLDNAVTNVRSKIARKTKRVKGKTRGYYESVGGCKKGKRPVTVTFTPESGSPTRSQGIAKCKS